MRVVRKPCMVFIHTIFLWVTVCVRAQQFCMGCLLLALELHAHVLDNRKYIFHCVVVCYMTLVHVVLIESKLFTCPWQNLAQKMNGFVVGSAAARLICTVVYKWLFNKSSHVCALIIVGVFYCYWLHLLSYNTCSWFCMLCVCQLCGSTYSWAWLHNVIVWCKTQSLVSDVCVYL